MSDIAAGFGRCEIQSGPIAGSTFVLGAVSGRRPVQYANVGGLAIFEGDIVLGRVADLSVPSAGDAGPVLMSVALSGEQFRWAGGRVPYEIDAALPDPKRVHEAIDHWEELTPLRFPEHTTETDYVRFVPGAGCSSNVGRRGGAQVITLGDNCSTGNAIHEIGHTVGLWHEQSREDRDLFITIDWSKIDPAMAHNFDQHITDGDDIGPYDYGSVMHYPRTAFSIDGQPTIIPVHPLPPGVVLGQRTGLSPGDIAAVRQLYPTVPTRPNPEELTVAQQQVRQAGAALAAAEQQRVVLSEQFQAAVTHLLSVADSAVRDA